MALSYAERLGLRQAIDAAVRAKWNAYPNGAEARHLSPAERDEREERDADLVLDVVLMLESARTRTVWRSSGLPKYRVIAALRRLESSGRIARGKSLNTGQRVNNMPWECI